MKPRATCRAVLACSLLLAGCASAPAPPAAPAAGPAAVGFPDAFYRQPPAAGRVFDLDPRRSRLQVLVFRAGALASQGHNHVVAATALRGAVFVPDAGNAGARVDLQVDSAGLEVDAPAARTRSGAAFAAPIAPRARSGTRANMLGPRVLDAARFPHIAVSAGVAAGELPWLLLDATVSLAGRSRRVQFPVRVGIDGTRLRADGRLALRPGDFGIEPFAAAGGLLRVADTVIVDFALVAELRALQ